MNKENMTGEELQEEMDNFNEKAKLLEAKEQEVNDVIDKFNKKQKKEDEHKKRAFIIRKLEGEIKNPIDLNKPKVTLCGEGKLVSSFAEEVSKIIKDKDTIFYKQGAEGVRAVVEIESYTNDKEGEDNKTKDMVYNGFSTIKAGRFISLIEKYMNTGIDKWIKEKREMVFKLKSLSLQDAAIVLTSDQFVQNIHPINRIFNIPMPIIYEGKLTFPKKGYDSRFKSWLPMNAPEISEPDMKLDEAKGIIEMIFKEFVFKTKQDKTNAIAGLLTPFLRGLYSKFTTRTPVFGYMANRPRIGKDYCAGITGCVYENAPIECAPISTADKFGGGSEEFTKRAIAYLLEGRRRLHFSNNQGDIAISSFESLITSPSWSARLLHYNQSPQLNNEMDFSFSGNSGLTYSSDFSNRCRFIRFFFDKEDVNARRYENPKLQEWVLENRDKVLSALYSLVNSWISNGSKKGILAFSSFHEWAEICGGIMENAGYDSPCISDKESYEIGGDILSRSFDRLYKAAFKFSPNKAIDRERLNVIAHEIELDYDLNNSRGDKQKFTNDLISFDKRITSGIRMEIIGIENRGRDQKYLFSKVDGEETL